MKYLKNRYAVSVIIFFMKNDTYEAHVMNAIVCLTAQQTMYNGGEMVGSYGQSNFQNNKT